MPDARTAHYTMGPSLMNQPSPKFETAAHSLYGSRGPMRAHNTGRQAGPPESIEASIAEAVGRVAGLSARQRNAVCNEMVRLTRDLSYIKQVMAEAHAKGPWSDQAAGISMDEGRPL